MVLRGRGERNVDTSLPHCGGKGESTTLSPKENFPLGEPEALKLQELCRVTPGADTAHAEKAAARAAGRTAPPPRSGAVSLSLLLAGERRSPFAAPLAPPPVQLAPAAALPWGPSGRSGPVAAPPAGSLLQTWRRRQWELMELPMNAVDKSTKRTGLGRCRHFFWLGVAFDTVGATLLFTGVFADLLFYDLLLYLGSIIIFLSLLWWVFWYTGNIELTSEEALNRSYLLPSATILEALNQTISNRLSLTIGSISNTFLRIRRRRRRRRHRRRFLEGTASLNMTVTGQVENQPDQGDHDKSGMKSVKESGDVEYFGREDLPKFEAVESLKGVCSLGPDARPLGPKAGVLRFVEGQSVPLVQPFTPSSLDQPLTPAILASKSLPTVPLASKSQHLPILTSKSQPVVSLASTSQLPSGTLASRSQPAIPLASKSQPVVSLASTSQLPADTLASEILPSVSLSSQSQPLAILTTAISVASQGFPLVPVAAQSHLQIPLASQSQLQNLFQTSQTQPPPVQASEAQSLATPVSLLQLLPTQSFQTQPVDPHVAEAFQDFQALYHTQQASQSSSLVQRIGPSRSPSAPEIQEKPVAFKSLPPAGQEKPTDTASLLPESPAPGAQTQPSAPPGGRPPPSQERKRYSLAQNQTPAL
nr:uncharacterized protein LOC105091393 [Camelus dromedarius]